MLVETLFRSWTFWGEAANWDGGWYLAVADGGYPTHFLHYTTMADQTTLGFFPLYPIVIWLTAHFGSLHPGWHLYELAGLLIALLTGAIATVLIGRLATGWWGRNPAAARSCSSACSQARSCSRWLTPRA